MMKQQQLVLQNSLAVIMSIIPWQQVDPDNSPFVKLFALIGIPFAAGLIFTNGLLSGSTCCQGIIDMITARAPT
jgi:D-serine/D-alanine/glycine transporter